MSVINRSKVTKTLRIAGKTYTYFYAGSEIDGHGYLNLPSANKFCDALRKGNLACHPVNVKGLFFIYVRPKTKKVRRK